MIEPAPSSSFRPSLLTFVLMVTLLVIQPLLGKAAIDTTIKDTTVLRLMTQLNGAEEDTNKVELLCDLSLKLVPSNREKSIEAAREALDLSQKLDYQKGIAAAYNVLGLNEDQAGHYPEAIDLYLKALRISEKIGPRVNVGHLLHNIGLDFTHQQDYEKALDYLTQALEVNRELNFHDGIANTLNSIGTVYRNLDSADQAIDYHERALAEAKIAGNERYIAISSLNLAGDLDYIENFDRVRTAFHEALEAFTKMGDTKGIAISYNNLGAAHMENSKWEEGIVYLESSIEKAKEIDFKALLAHNYNLINTACAKAGDFERAHEYALLLNELNAEMLNESKVQAIAELETQYQVERKKQALIDQEVEIERLEKDAVIRNYTIFGILAVVVIIGLLVWLWFRNYQQKRAVEDLAIRHQLDLYVQEIELLKNQSPAHGAAPANGQSLPATLSDLLSDREMEVFRELANGKTNKEMAETLFVSVNTIKSHLKIIYEKLDVRNRTQAVKKVLEAETLHQ